jgi:GntR family uxuAB operon transcriptional repressor
MLDVNLPPEWQAPLFNLSPAMAEDPSNPRDTYESISKILPPSAPKVNHFWSKGKFLYIKARFLVYFWHHPGSLIMNSTVDQKLGAVDIAALIRREISKGHLQLNDRLPPERVLAETYKSARGTIRKALTRLEREGFVEIRPGSGTYVVHKPDESGANPIENATPLELIDARFALEPHICRLAVLHGRRSDFDKMEQLCTLMETQQEDPVAFSEADTDFHRALADSTRNGLLIWVIDQIANVRSQDDWTRMRHLTLDGATINQYNSQHRQILNAIRMREPERAANIMKEHLEYARLSLTRASET